MAAARCDFDTRQALWGRFAATASLDDAETAKRLLDDLEEQSGTTADELIRIATGRLVLTSLTGRNSRTLNAVEVLAPLASRVQDPLIHSSFLNVHSALLALGGRYEDALRSAEREIDLSSLYGLLFAASRGHFQRAVASLGLRAFRECKTSMRICEQALAPQDKFLRMNIGILRARVLLASGSTESLAAFERYQHRLSKAMDAEYFAWWSLGFAVACQPNRAERLAARAESMSSRIEVSALVPWTRAVLALENGRSQSRSAQEAFDRTLETGNVDAFVTAYRARSDILELLVKNRQNHDQLRVILERARDHRLAELVGLRLPVTSELQGLNSLSKREREVLDLISEGLMNKEIARTLFITESTAKAHVRSICNKLGVRTRTEAAMRAAELLG
jgi:DNA-binding CsgD family transcriptional regulator